MPNEHDFTIRPETAQNTPRATHDGSDIPRTAGIPFVRESEKPPLPGIPSIRPDTIVEPEPPRKQDAPDEPVLPMPGVPAIEPKPPKP